MQPRLQATLADFVPALRFLPPERVAEHLGRTGLPAAWWAGVPVVQAAGMFAPGELSERLADLAYAELQHLRLGDLLPAAWLARNDFRLSRWPAGVRTNVLVRTPDWADLLTATVHEIAGWTQVGPTTVRPVVATLFAEVLGLLPAADELDEADAAVPVTLTKAPANAVPQDAEDTPAPFPASGVDADPPRDIEDITDFGDIGYDDELRTVPLPEPLTDDLATVVRWLAQEAPDVPLMSELVRVTLETVMVVGIDDAPHEVRTSLDRLMPLVPGSLLPDGLGAPPAPPGGGYDDGHEDPYPGESLADPHPAAAADPQAPEASGLPDPARVGAPRAADAVGFAAAAPDDAPADAVTPDGVDAFGETPPLTRDDLPTPGPAADDATGDGADEYGRTEEDSFGVDAFGEVPNPTRDDMPAAVSASAGADTVAPAGPAGPPAEKGPAEEPGTAELSVRRDAPAVPPRPSSPPPSNVPSVTATAPPGVLPPVPAPPDPASLPGRDRGPDLPDLEGTVVMASGQTPIGEDATVMIGRRPAASGPRSGGPGRGRPGKNAPGPDDGTGGGGAAPAAGNLAMVLASWFSGQDPRWRSIARDRLFTDSPREIASLAAEFDADSTEVEALEAGLLAYLAEQAEGEQGSQVGDHLRWVREQVGGLTTVAELRDLHDKHSASVPGLGLPVWQVVRGLLRLHTSADGWLSAEPTGELAARTAEVLASACARGPVPVSAVRGRLAALGIRPLLQQAWVGRLDEFRVENGQVLSADADTLERPATPPGAPAAAGGGPESAARCFADEQGTWWYRVDVTEEYLAGARLPLPAGFVTPLGLDEDGQLRLHHPLGPAALRWADEGPYCVSLAAVLTGMGAADGDMVFVASVRPGRLEARLLPGDRAVRLPRWARALRRTGVDPVPDQVNLPAMLGERIGLGTGCDLKTVLKRLQERGDGDVLELLGVVPSRR